MNKRYLTRILMALSVGALLLSASFAALAQTLQHEYKFFASTNDPAMAFDAIGTNNGTLGGDAVITGGQLQLDGSAYVQLQPGIVTNDLAVTVEVWGDYPDLTEQAGWANLFDFGTKDVNNNDSYSISFCADTVSPAESLDAALSDTDNANATRDNCYADANLIANGVGAYIAAVYNPPSGYIAIYVNGKQVSKIATAQTITPGVRDRDNWIGWDNWPDPKLTANLDDFRVWNGALDGFAIAASYQNGFSTLNTNAGTVTGITLSAGAQVVQGGQEPASVIATASLITNTVDVSSSATYQSGSTNIVTVDSFGNIHGVGIGSTTVTATYGGKSSSPVTVTVVEPVSILTHRYSFTTDGSDSVGGRTGLLVGGATISNNAVVLNGSSAYVDLSANPPGQDGIISGYQSATVDYWATFGTLGNWNYAWAFGNTVNNAGQNYIHSVARDGDQRHEIDNYTTAGGSGLAALGQFTGQAIHCTTVIDPPTGHLAIYTNGVLSGYVANDFAPLSSIATNEAYIGHSLWTADPYLPASIDEFRVYNGTLTPQQIALANILGPSNTNLVVGALQSIAVSIPTMHVGDLYRGGLEATYSNLTNFDVVANTLTPVLVYTSSNSNVVYQASDGFLHAVSAGTATITANYGGFTANQSVSVTYAPVLVNRYSFHDAPGSTTAVDSVGGWNGTVFNGGTFTGTNLELLGGSIQYVQLPPGILSNYTAVTVDMWCDFPTQLPVNCMLYAFGNTDTNSGLGYDYIFCAPQGGRIAITGVDPGYAAEQGCGGAGDLSFAQNIHLTSVYDPPAHLEQWYTNGVLVSQNTNVTTAFQYVESTINYLGHSVYTGDPHEDVNFNEVRIYNGALSPADIARSQTLGPSVLLSSGGSGPTLTATISGGNVVISWPSANATGFSLYTSPALGSTASWTQVSQTPTTVGQNLQVTLPATGTAFFELKK